MPHSDDDESVASAESVNSFDYEDDDNSMISFEADSDEGSPTNIEQDVEGSPVESRLLWQKPSSNHLCQCRYRSMKVNWYIMERFVMPARKLANTVIPGLSLDELLVMLHYKKWSVDELTSDFFDNSNRLRERCGLSEKVNAVYPITKKGSDFMCMICCESGPLDTFSLSCGHEFCVPCYSQYLHIYVGKGELIRCMEPSCSKSLYHTDVEKILQYGNSTEVDVIELKSSGSSSTSESQDSTFAEADFKNYELSVINEYDLQFDGVEFANESRPDDAQDPLSKNSLLRAAAKLSLDGARSRYKWCPAVDCENFVELSKDTRPYDYDYKKTNLLTNVPVVRCPASHEFCFDCQFENHLPCPCDITAKWVKRCQDDSETANWIEANTQNCPKCSSSIEKNGGCNHMLCQHCRFEFCWICLHDWRQHTQSHWSCNRYKERKEDTSGKLQKQNALARYLHYYKRFSVHQHSMKGDERTLANIHRYMLLYMKSQTHNSKKNVSWNDAQFMSDAIRSLICGRRTLMWTYAFTFYLEKSNYCDIFEGMQDYLNETVEALSRIFEDVGVEKKKKQSEENIMQALTKKKSKIVHLSALIAKRQRLLVECANHGISDGSLIFTEIK
ncbi:hypothetical protein FDK38_001153 [Candidozyma auris]|nr:hypothetical protein FDK38_001153 [[Candida] auris]